jgi:hypothetical protein
MPALAFSYSAPSNNGSFVGGLTGGTPGYTFSVDGAPFVPAYFAYGGYFVYVNNLSLGSHTIVVRDAATPYEEITHTFTIRLLDILLSCLNSGPGNAQGTIQNEYDAPNHPGWYTQTSRVDGQPLGSSQTGTESTVVFLANGDYLVELYDDQGQVLDYQNVTIACGSSAPLSIVNLNPTDASAAGVSDGTVVVNIQDGQGFGPGFIVECQVDSGGWSAATLVAGDNFTATLTGLSAGPHTLFVRDSSLGMVQQNFTIGVAVAPVFGCMDEYGSDYDPDATQSAACTYVPAWRSAWQDMAVRVAAVQGQTESYIEAHLIIGFRTGHPLAVVRPQAAPVLLRATVSPTGYALFKLGHYLRTELGAPDGSGGYRLDLNSGTSLSTDLFVGYELRRTTGEMLQHGYALNSALPDDDLHDGLTLSPFARLPIWPGFDDYRVMRLSSTSAGRYPTITNSAAVDGSTVLLACPINPVPVVWLAPGSGYGYWVFQGRPQLGDEVGEGQTFQEAKTGETRYSQRGETRKTISASSGTFDGQHLLDGLRTLTAAPQIWYKPTPTSDWVPVTLDGSSFPAGRLGVRRTEVRITLKEGKARPAQGQ